MPSVFANRNDNTRARSVFAGRNRARSVFAQRNEQQNGGLLSIPGNIIREIGRDIQGFGNVAGATVGEVLNAIGFSMPHTFEDLDQRDIKGALMLGALFGSAGVGSILRGSAAFGASAKALGASVKGRAALTGAVEAAAGSAFGLLRPLEGDDSRLRAIIGDAALFGAFGVGASATKSAIMSVLSAKSALIIRQGERSAVSQALSRSVQIDQAKEITGAVLINPITGARRTISRDASTGALNVIKVSADGETSSLVSQQQFGQELANAVKEGFTDAGAMLPSPIAYAKGLKSLDEGVIAHLKKLDGDLPTALGKIELTDYEAVRTIADLDVKAIREANSLAAEILVPGPNTTLGAPQLSAKVRSEIIRQVPDLINGSDAEVLRGGIRAGVVGINNIKDGFSINKMMQELALNDQVLVSKGIISKGVTGKDTPNLAFDIVVSKAHDAWFTRWWSPLTTARWHPEVKPWVDSTSAMAGVHSQMLKDYELWRNKLIDTVSKQELLTTVKGIDASAESFAVLGDISAAQRESARTALATGNQNIVHADKELTNRFISWLDQLKAGGHIEEGLAGYFPMVNANKYRLGTVFNGEEKFAGFFATKREADKALAKLVEASPGMTGESTVNGFFWSQEALPEINQLFRDKLVDSVTTKIGGAGGRVAAGIDEALSSVLPGFKGVEKAAQKPGAGFLKPRIINVRDFSKDPIEAMDIYAHNVIRKLAYGNLEKETATMLSQISESKPQLKRFVEQMRDDLLGRPRAGELAFDNVMNHMAEHLPAFDVQPRALKRYSSLIRQYESASRLGGLWSPIVNATQVGNIIIKIGPKYTARAMLAFMSGPKSAAKATGKMMELGIDMNMMVSLTEEGLQETFTKGIGRAIKNKEHLRALHNMSLFLFNKVEVWLRNVAAYGGYLKKLDELGSGVGNEKLAGGFAQEVVNSTQFVYNTANMPEILRGPVGGVILQFKSFFIKELEFIGSLNNEEMIRLAATMSAIGGTGSLFNIPGADIVDKATSVFFDQSASEALKLKAGESKVGRVAVYGLPGLLGVDIGESAGVPSLVDTFDQLIGPAASDIKAITQWIGQSAADIGSVGFPLPETNQRMIQKVMPSAIRRAMRGVDIYRTGEVRSAYSGKLIYQPDNRLLAAYTQVIGAPAIEQGQNFIRDQVVTRVRDRYIAGRSSFAKEAARAIKDGDGIKARSILAQAQVNGYSIDAQSLRYYVNEIDRDANERRSRRTPVQLRERLAATGVLQPELP